MFEQVRPAITLSILFSVLLGMAYPLAITGAAGILSPQTARGSVLYRDGIVVGSSLIGQRFVSESYFWSRPSATSPEAYDASASTGSNLAPTSAALMERIKQSVALLGASTPVPADAVTTSASGLDPDISPAFAALQVDRVARARKLEPAQVTALVKAGTQWPFLGIFGEPRVNVLALNLALDEATAK